MQRRKQSRVSEAALRIVELCQELNELVCDVCVLERSEEGNVRFVVSSDNAYASPSFDPLKLINAKYEPPLVTCVS